MGDTTKTVALADDVHSELKHRSVDEEESIRKLVDDILREDLDIEGEYPLA